MKKRILSILLAVLMLLSVLPVTAMAADGTTDMPVTMTSGNTDGPKLRKTAQWEDKNAGIAKITMEVWGEPSQQSTEFGPTDIVLVVDCSGSMLGTRIEKAKTAARDFVEQFLGEKGTDSSRANVQIGVVTYNTTANRAAELSNSKDELNNKINTINATYDTGTNIQAGIHTAQTMLGEDTRTGVAKYMIVLSDGEPTHSYYFKATGKYERCDSLHIVTDCYGGHFTGISQFSPDYTKIAGSGSKYTCENAYISGKCTKHKNTTVTWTGAYVNGSFSKDGTSNNGVATIWEANQAKANGTTIYSIGFGSEIGTAQKPDNAYNTMVAIASSPDKYKAASESDVSNVFDAIATEIKSYTAYNARVTDPMGAGFAVIQNDTTYPITVANGETASVDAANGNLVWKVAKELDETKHTITFYIQYNTSTASNNNNPLPTNNGAELTFTTDKEGKVQGTPVTVGDPELENPSKKVSYDDGYNGQYTGTADQYKDKYYWPTTDVAIADDLISAAPDGYEFDGWYRGNNKAEDFQMPSEDVELVAHWKKTDEQKTLTITKQWAAGSKEADSVTIAVKNGTNTIETVTLTESDNWTKTVTVPKYSYDDTTNNATEINYTIEETGVNGTNSLNDVENNIIVGTWIPSYEPATDTNRTVTNTYTAGQTYGVTYVYSDENNLPEAVKKTLPTDTKRYHNGQTINPQNPSQTSVDVGEATYTFNDWNQETATVNGADVTFTGSWTKTDYQWRIVYEWEAGTPSGAGNPPTDETLYKDEAAAKAAATKEPSTKVFRDGHDTWTFDKWDNGTVKGTTLTYTGTWTSSHDNTYNVKYEYTTQNLPKAVTDTLPATTTAYDKDEVHPMQPRETEVPVEGGKWKFEGWDAASKTVNGADVTFTGTWKFTSSEQPPEKTYDVSLTITKTVDNVHGTAPAEDYKFVVYYYNSRDEKVYLRDKDHPLTISLDAGEDSKEKDFTIEMTQTQLDSWPETLVREGIYEGRVRFVYVEEIDGGTDHMTYAKTPVRGQFVGIAISSMRSVTKYFLYSEQNWQGIFSFTNVYNKTTGRDVTPAKVSPQLNRDDHVAYIMGYPDGKVRPEGEITRAEACTIFFRLLTKESRDYYFSRTNDYTDVSRTDWFNNAISTLSNAGIVTGYADGTFRPDQPITRGEMAKIIANFARLGGATKSFTDLSGHWAKSYVELAAGNGWIAGYPDGTFGPDKKITRAETVTMINRVLERVPAKESRLLSRSVMLTFPDNEPGEWYYIAVQEASNSHTYQRSAYETAGDEMWLRLIENVDWTKLEK